jgi:hypothetical protein
MSERNSEETPDPPFQLIPMSLLANQIEWWPLHAALAWVYSRDVSFILWAAEHGYRSLREGIEGYERSTEKSVTAVLNSEADAWPTLREAIAKGAVRARGVPSNDDELPSISSSALEEALQPAEATEQILKTHFRTMWLRSKYYSFNRRWHNVKIARNDLEKHFPAADCEQSLRQAAAESPRPHRRMAVEEAIRNKYGPSGPGLGILVKQVHQDVNTLLKERGVHQVSLSTVRRALKKVRLERN